MTDTIPRNGGAKQILDTLKVEKERGITGKRFHDLGSSFHLIISVADCKSKRRQSLSNTHLASPTPNNPPTPVRKYGGIRLESSCSISSIHRVTLIFRPKVSVHTVSTRFLNLFSSNKVTSSMPGGLVAH